MVRNGVRWPGGGDIDHLVRSPDGVGFAIETKTRTFGEEHLRRTAATARWAARRRRRYPRVVVPVLCVARANRVEYRLGAVVVVSLDRLRAVLEGAAKRGWNRARAGARDRTDRPADRAGHVGSAEAGAARGSPPGIDGGARGAGR